ncbi:MAG: chemotaxis protein CheW [Myxococcota bacterium]
MAVFAQPQVDVLTFEVGGQCYALPSRSVREVLRAVSIVPLPSGPRVVEGIINVRGSVVPVLDIRSRFRLPPKSLEHTDHLVVAWAGRRVVAIRADRAQDVLRIDGAQLEDVAVAIPGAGYVAGVAKLRDGLLLIHDLETFLAEAEATALDAAVATVSSEDSR